MEFSESELNVLRNAFIASDLDGDGVISKSDLRMTSGLGSEEEVDALMYAMKDAAGNINTDECVSFEEFILGVVDFPFLLEQFK
jgi:hypothetical protein